MLCVAQNFVTYPFVEADDEVVCWEKKRVVTKAWTPAVGGWDRGLRDGSEAGWKCLKITSVNSGQSLFY